MFIFRHHNWNSDLILDPRNWILILKLGTGFGLFFKNVNGWLASWPWQWNEHLSVMCNGGIARFHRLFRWCMALHRQEQNSMGVLYACLYKNIWKQAREDSPSCRPLSFDFFALFPFFPEIILASKVDGNARGIVGQLQCLLPWCLIRCRCGSIYFWVLLLFPPTPKAVPGAATPVIPT